MRIFPACGLTASRIAFPASRSTVERKHPRKRQRENTKTQTWDWNTMDNAIFLYRSLSVQQLGGLPVPWLPWLPVRAGDGSLQAVERVGRQPPPDPVHAQSEGHADKSQGLLWEHEQLETQQHMQEIEARVPPPWRTTWDLCSVESLFRVTAGKVTAKLFVWRPHTILAQICISENEGEGIMWNWADEVVKIVCVH